MILTTFLIIGRVQNMKNSLSTSIEVSFSADHFVLELIVGHSLTRIYNIRPCTLKNLRSTIEWIWMQKRIDDFIQWERNESMIVKHFRWTYGIDAAESTENRQKARENQERRQSIEQSIDTVTEWVVSIVWRRRTVLRSGIESLRGGIIREPVQDKIEWALYWTLNEVSISGADTIADNQFCDGNERWSMWKSIKNIVLTTKQSD